MGWKTRLGGVTAAALVLTAVAAAPALADTASRSSDALRFAADDESPCAGVAFPLELGDGNSFHVVRADDPGDPGEEGTLSWAVAQANEHPGIDEVVIDVDGVVETRGGIAISDGLILRGATPAAEIRNRSTDTTRLFESDAADTEFSIFISQLVFSGAAAGEGDGAGGLDLGSGVCALGLHDVTVQGFVEYGVLVGESWPFELLEVERSVFRENGKDSSYEGALTVSNEGVNGRFVIRDSLFADNDATGLAFPATIETSTERTAELLIEGSSFENNAGIDQLPGGVWLTSIYVEDREPEPEGWAPIPDTPIVTVRDSQFRGNTGGGAGGMAVDHIGGDFEEGTALHAISFERTTFDGNTATGHADGLVGSDLRIYEAVEIGASGSTLLSVSDSTFNGDAGAETPNVALSNVVAGTRFQHVTMVGGGIAYGEAMPAGASLSLENSVIDSGAMTPVRFLEDPESGSLPEAGEIHLSESHMAYTTAPEAALAPGDGRLVRPVGDYLLGALDDTLGLTPVRVPGEGSLLIDAAGEGGATTDQRGATRPHGEAADIGSVEVLDDEVDPVPAAVTVGPDQRGSGGNTLTFTVTRTPGSEPGESRVRVSTSDGSAVAGPDYDALTTELVWSEGDPDTKTVAVRTAGGHEGSAPKSFTVTIADPSDGTVLGERVSATGTIDYAKEGSVTPPGETHGGKQKPLPATGQGPALWPLSIAAILLLAGGAAFGLRRLRGARAGDA